MSYMNYYRPDTTGTNPLYKVENDIYTYFEHGMAIEFDSPIFYDSLVITSGADGSVWKDGIGYYLANTDRDTTSEARARNLDAGFSGRLTKKIILNTDVVTPYQISITYQTFYPSSATPPIDSTNGVMNFTPSALADIYKRLMSVEQKSLSVVAKSMPEDALVTPLAEDIDCENPDNVLTETYSVNTFNGRNTIFPRQGAFFKDSVTITINGNPLTVDKDYIAVNFDRFRTALTSNKSGIYHSLVILKDYAGDDVKVTYHAVGGNPTNEDIIRLQAGQKDIIAYLNSTQYLTTTMLSSDPNFAALDSRIALLEKENNMRALMQNPTYGRTTNGTTVARSFKAPDTGLHWWNIGSLYQVDNSTEIFTADTMEISIEMPDRHLRADLYLSVDILNKTQPLKISAKNVLYDQGYTFYGSQSASLKPPILFRIIYNETVDNTSGVLLQIGTSIPSLVEKFAITDNSSVESAFLLALQSSSDAATPNDVSPITLPNNTRVWNSTGTQSASAIVTMPLDEGHLVFNGSADLTSISAPVATNSVPFKATSLLAGWQPITQASSMDVYYTSANGNGKITLPAFYDLSKQAVSAQSAVSDFEFNDQSLGTLRMTLSTDQITMFYTGNTQAKGAFAINYVTLHTGNTPDVYKGQA